MMMASALQCLRGRLAASAVPAALLPIASALNRGGRGFAAAPAAGGSGGSPPPPPQEGVDSKQAQQQDGKQPKQQDVQQQQQRHQHSSEDPGVPAASAGSSPPTSEAPPFASGAGGGGGGHHPDLHKYIASLASLKGSTTVLRQEMGGDAKWWQTILSSTVGPWLQGWISDFVRSRVETEFDADEFTEGAMDAYFMVHELLAQEDWAALRGMMSAKLLSAFQDTVGAYRGAGLVWRTTLAGGEVAAGIRGMGFLTRQQMAEYDEEQAALAPDDDNASRAVRPTGMWLVLTVQLQAEQQVTITREEDGHIVAQLADKRPVRWRFAAGPLPGPLPVRRLPDSTPWMLLSI